MSKFIYFIIGASGVGKTTLVEALAEKYKDESGWAFVHFDTILIPSAEEMVAEYGGGEAWQKAKTKEWVNRLLSPEFEEENLVFEGQVNPAFVIEAFAAMNFQNFKLILVDVPEDIMIDRLKNDRNQPELANQDMKNWRQFLRNQAEDLQIPILDNSGSIAIESLENLLSRTHTG